MNSTRDQVGPVLELGGASSWLILLPIVILTAYWWNTTHGKLQTGEPPLVPYYLPWLGHGITFMNDINAFVSWVR